MLDSADHDVAFLDNGATVGGSYIVGDGLDDGLAFQVDALNIVSCIGFSGIESDGDVQARVKSFAIQSEGGCKRLLFWSHFLFVFTCSFLIR